MTVPALFVAGGCSGDDDAVTTLPTDPPTVATTAATAAESPTTPEPATTPPPPPTLAPLDALKEQIAADYVRSSEATDALTRNPTLENLEAVAATIRAPGSTSYQGLIDLINDLVATGDRFVAGEPDYSEARVEQVEIDDVGAAEATVVACYVFNDSRINPAGQPVGDTGVLSAARVRQRVQHTPNGWLPSSAFTLLEAAEEVTECPPPR